MKSFTFIVAISASLGVLALAVPAMAADNPMQVCGVKYQAAKKANSLPAGQTWNQYLAQCRSAMKPAGAAPASGPKPAKIAAKGEPSAAQKAMYSRERECGKMWQADKAAHKTKPSETWPQYWSACNKRLKS